MTNGPSQGLRDPAGCLRPCACGQSDLECVTQATLGQPTGWSLSSGPKIGRHSWLLESGVNPACQGLRFRREWLTELMRSWLTTPEWGKFRDRWNQAGVSSDMPVTVRRTWPQRLSALRWRHHSGWWPLKCEAVSQKVHGICVKDCAWAVR